jgi:hypothetical protein
MDVGRKSNAFMLQPDPLKLVKSSHNSKMDLEQIPYEHSMSSKNSKMHDLGLSPIPKQDRVHFMTQENFFTTQEGDDAKLISDHG